MISKFLRWSSLYIYLLLYIKIENFKFSLFKCSLLLLIMNFSIVVATDTNGGIGNINLDFEYRLPWNCPTDMKFFKQLTTNSAIIMGKNTFLTLPNTCNGLKNRYNIVLSHCKDDELKNTSVYKANSINDALNHCLEKNFSKVFVIGGSSVYNQALEHPNLETIYWNIIPEKYRTLPSTIHFSANFIETMSNYNMEHTCIDDINCYKFTSKLKETNSEEMQYLNICKQILNHGVLEEGRNGFTKSIFGTSMRFSLQNNTIPIFTTKKVAWKTCLKELLWFIRGSTDNNILRDQNVHIWDGNSTKEYLMSVGLDQYDENELGPCFVEKSKVLTYEGYKNIEDIQIGELVSTHLGNFKKVSTTMKRIYTGNIYNIRSQYSPYPIRCTSEHPFYVRSFKIKNRVKINGVEKRNVVYPDEPCFLPASELQIKKYLMGIKIEEDEIIPKIIINKRNKMYEFTLDNPDLWWTMGLFVGDGWIVKEKYSHRIYFVIANHQIDLFLPKLLKVIPSLSLCETLSGCKKFKASNYEISTILQKFGKYSHGKLIPQFIHKAPKYLIEEFLNGYICADGCKRVVSTNESIRLTTVSYNLAFSVQKLYAKLGFIGGLCCSHRENKTQRFPNGKIYKCRDAYFFEVYLNGKRRNNYSFIERGYMWTVINKIDIDTVEQIPVYNLSVDDDNTYTVNNIITHNCYGRQWRNFNGDYIPNITKRGIVSQGVNYNGKEGISQFINEIDDVAEYLKQTYVNDLSYDELLLKNKTLNDIEHLNKKIKLAAECESKKGVDQLQYIIDCLKDPTKRTSRRLIMTAWNPCQIDQMALPPCHILCQFNVHDGNKLSCSMYQRSQDEALGVPFNVTSYSFLTHLLAKHCGLEAYEFVHFGGNAHIYKEHIEPMEDLLKRNPFKFPTIEIKNTKENINDYIVSDFIVNNYKHHEPVKMNMVP